MIKFLKNIQENYLRILKTKNGHAVTALREVEEGLINRDYLKRIKKVER